MQTSVFRPILLSMIAFLRASGVAGHPRRFQDGPTVKDNNDYGFNATTAL
jgi:hypothetical protein